MARAIDADDLKKCIMESVGKYHDYDKIAICRDIDKQPTIETAPVKNGKWINAYPEIEPNPMFMYGICPKCGNVTHYGQGVIECPKCGWWQFDPLDR